MSKLKEKMIKLRDAAEKAAAEHILTDEGKVSAEVQAARYATCQGCEHLHEATNRCRLCGCFMGVKTWMKRESCPIKKWTSEEI
jgi:hypothetical protein